MVTARGRTSTTAVPAFTKSQPGHAHNLSPIKRRFVVVNVVLGWATGGAVAENTGAATVVGVLDLDVGAFPASVASITIASVAGVTFSVDPTTFAVTATGGFDHETLASRPLGILITYVDSTDNGGETLSLTISDVNEAPAVTGYHGVTSASISETAAAGREVARVTISDPDAGENVTLSLIGADAGFFVLDGLRVRLASGVTLDHATAASLSFSVRGTDTGGLTADQAFTVNVLDSFTDASGLQAALGGSGTSLGLTVALTDDGPRLEIGGQSAVLSGASTLQLADGELAFGASTDLASIERMYQGLLGRSANGSEMMIRANFVTHGGPLNEIMSFILASDEFSLHVQANTSANDAAALTNGEFVELLYGRVLGRGSDSGGLAFWTAVLEGGFISRADVALGFTNSSEAQTRFSSDTQALWAADEQAHLVRSLYDVAFNREPDAGGLAYWSGLLEQGLSTDIFVDFLVASSEFQTRIAGMTTSQIVQQFYLDGLERTADDGGLAFWTGVIDGGLADWSDVLLGFATSTEQDGQLANYREGSDIFVT